MLSMLCQPLVFPAQAQVTGGPIIDAAVYGNKEFYPGQTAPLFVVVQNKGYLESLYGFKNQEIQLSLDNLKTSTTGDYSQSLSSSASSELGTSSSFSNESQGFSWSSELSGLSDVAANKAASVSQTQSQLNSNWHIADTIGGVEHNTQSGVTTDATTALGLVCQLKPGDAPLEVVTGDRGIVGSLAPGQVGGGPNTLYTLSFGLYQPLQFWIRVNPDAKPGHYVVPLVCTYKQLIDDYSSTSLDGTVFRHKNYVERCEIIPLEIVVMPKFDLVLSNVVSTEMVPDTNGYITMTVKNMGNLSVTQAVAFLMQPRIGTPQDEVSSNYPLNYELSSFLATIYQQPQEVAQKMVVPLQNSQYLGDIGPGESRDITFKVSISREAEASTFPLSAVVSYHDQWDKEKSSNIRTFGVPVQKEMQFGVSTGKAGTGHVDASQVDADRADSDPVEIQSGSFKVANITLTNLGGETARNAIVRMNALDPFTVSYDTTFLGDVAPGQSVNTLFGIKVKPDAVPTDYYVSLEVKYYDSRNDPHITKVIPMQITVLPPPTIWDTIMENWWIILIVALILLLLLAYMVYMRLKKKKKPPTEAKGEPGSAGEPPESAGKSPESGGKPESEGKPPETAEKPPEKTEQSVTDSERSGVKLGSGASSTGSHRTVNLASFLSLPLPDSGVVSDLIARIRLLIHLP